MNDESKDTPYFSADFGEHGGRHEWKSHEEVVGWLSNLQNQWSWLGSLQQDATNRAWQVVNGPITQAVQYLQEAANSRARDPKRAEEYLKATCQTMESVIRPNPWLLPNSAQRKFVEEIRDEGDKLEAGLIVAHWLKQGLHGAPISSVVNALLRLGLYERGIKDRAKAESATLKKLAGDMQSALIHYQELERAQTSRFDALHDELSEQKVAQQKSFDEAQQQRSEDWALQRHNAQQELDNIKNTYDQYMALAAPVEYWEDKRAKHHRLMLWSGGAVILGMIAAAGALTWKIQSISEAISVPHTPLTGQPMASSSVSVASTVQTAGILESPTWHLGSFLVFAILAFWFVRLLVRIFLSNMHLENDAAERVTMAKTYLALLRSDGLPKGDSINTILAALFRPTGDGIVKDEGVPPSTLEWFTKLGR